MTTLIHSENYLDFSKRLKNIDEHTSELEKESIHFKSLSNFIYHYQFLKKSRQAATELLDEYIKVIESNGYHFSEEQCKGAFDLFIAPLASKIYTRYLHFSSDLSWILIILFISIPLVFLWFLFHSTILLQLVGSLFLIHWINYIRKYYTKKIYGYRY